MTRPVHCTTHGTSPYSLICTHLAQRASPRYYLLDADGEDPAQAWCEPCDAVLEEEQGWNDRADSQADWQLFCTHCFEAELTHAKRLGNDEP